MYSLDETECRDYLRGSIAIGESDSQHQELAMRPPAKPFTVEIKRSRKSEAEQPAPKPTWFSEASARLARSIERSSPTQTATPTSAPELAVRSEPAPALARVLPDLNAQAKSGPAKAERVLDRPPALPKPKMRREKIAKPVVEPVRRNPKATVAAPASDPLPTLVRVRRRRRPELDLPRGERWKRRLPAAIR